MKIPKTIKILAHTITVKHPHVFTERSDAFGVADTKHNMIYLEGRDDSGAYAESAISQTFLHEIVHFISKYVSGNTALYGSEELHDLFCEILFQVLRDNKLDFADKGNK